jgi:hypothetical protein
VVHCRECGDAVTDGHGGYRLCLDCSADVRRDGADDSRLHGRVSLWWGVALFLVEVAASGHVDEGGSWQAAVHVAIGLGLLRAARREDVSASP